MSIRTTLIGVLMGGVVLAGCAVQGQVDPRAGGRLAPPPVEYSSLVTHPDRPAEDFADDPARLPAKVLEFAGLTYGMTIVEIEAGNGYYTELMAHAIGPEGRVFMQNPLAFDNVFGDAIAKRLDGRLRNVQAMRTNFDELTVADNSADLVTWFLGPHKLWFRPGGAPAEVFGNPDKAFAEIARVLKPGAVFVAMDHVAAAGTLPETGSDAFRIDPAIVKDHAKRAGLELVETSDLFANPEDDYSVSAFDPEVRLKTDRFIFKFRKPG